MKKLFVLSAVTSMSLSAVFCAGGQAQEKPPGAEELSTLTVLPAAGTERLSPEMAALLDSGGALAGVTNVGGVSLDLDAEQTKEVKLSDGIKMFKVEEPEPERKPWEAPPEPEPPVEIILSYTTTGRPGAKCLAEANVEVLEDNETARYLVVTPKDRMNAEDVNRLLKDKCVEYIQPSYRITTPALDTLERVDMNDIGALSFQPFATGGENNALFDKLWGMQKISAPMAWESVHDAEKLIVAVIDTGVDHQHPDLKDNMWSNPLEANGRPGVDDDGNGYVDDIHGYDFYEEDGDPMDESDHGTHCAGTIAGIGDNRLGIVGVSWKARIMGVRFIGPAGGNTSDAIRCIDYAVDNGAHVLSCSWGGGPFSKELSEAMARAERKGVLVIIAAGNSNKDNDARPAFPSNFENGNIIAVGAIDRNDQRASFSHYGKTSVDIGAPGVKILSTVGGGEYGTMSGTSMATPHVSGAALLAWANQFEEPKQDIRQMYAIRALLLDNAREVGSLGEFWGHNSRIKGGILDLAFLEKPAGPGGATGPGGGGGIGSGGIAVASDEFAWGEKTASRNTTLARAEIELAVRSLVHVRANTSATCEETALRFTTGFTNEDDPGAAWENSMRLVEVTSRGRWVNFGSTAAIQLPAGKHTIRWNVLVEDATLEFDSGSLLIQAFPVK